VVYDCTNGWDFYGPGAGYHFLAGQDASVSLAKVSFDKQHVGDGDVTKLTDSEKGVLVDWEVKVFKKKYTPVGKLVREGEAS
jgi:membrane-associated progesterone receptor component